MTVAGRRAIASAVLSVIAQAGAGSYAASEPAVVRVEAEVSVRVAGHIVVTLPPGYDEDPAREWPLVFFLHGSGERGTDPELVTKHGPFRALRNGAELPFILVAPQCPADERWSLAWMRAALDDAVDRYRVDSERVYLTGLSMGGQGVWKFATADPDRFAALAPVCGRSYPDRAERIAHIPTWVFHGARDRVVPVSESENMVAALRRVGGSPKLTVHPEGTHDVWTETYDDPELYAWMLRQRRSVAVVDVGR